MENEEFLKHSTTHPKYLESNSTSHSWAFGAVAELLDNAADANATEVQIDVTESPEYYKMMIVQDNGCGMDYRTLHKMLSFGHCTKENGEIGRYGNGFKSGSMRMGSDAIVFTKDGKTKSVGMLSRTFLEKTNAVEVLVPMVTWSETTGEFVFRSDSKEAKFMQNSLKVIHEHSPFHGMRQIEAQFDYIEERGTRIVIWNLRKIEGTQQFELDFDQNDHDVLLSEATLGDNKNMDSESNEYLTSLKKYCKILYLVPKMKIFLRGKRVKTVIFSKTLYLAKTTVYKPKAHGDVNITYGFNPNRRVFGMMLYNKNRLIESFLPLGIHMEHSSRGKGVLGVCDAHFLQPTHNKQKFVATADYNKLRIELARRLRVYWDGCDLTGRIGDFWTNHVIGPDETWLQCDKCLKWRFVDKTLSSKKKDGAAFECSMITSKTFTKLVDKAKENENHLPAACHVPQDTHCSTSKVKFQSIQSKPRIPAGREKWIGARVSLYWTSYDKWFEGIVKEFDEKKNKYKVLYDDGDFMWESYDDGFKVLKMPEELKKDKKDKKVRAKKRKIEADSDDSTDGHTKKKSRLQATYEHGRHGHDDDSDDSKSTKHSRENELLKKKLSFIVNSLAEQGLITTDFIDLVEEDNLIELDEVKLCESFKAKPSQSSSSNNNVNIAHKGPRGTMHEFEEKEDDDGYDLNASNDHMEEQGEFELNDNVPVAHSGPITFIKFL